MAFPLAAHKISHAQAKKAISKYEAVKNKIANLREKAEETTKKVVRTAEVSGTAFVMGLVQGRTGGVELPGGIPLELGVGGVLTVFGLFGGAGSYSDHLHNAGDGALAAYMTTLGRGVGADMRAKSGGGGALGSGSGQGHSVSKGVHLSPEEVQEMAGNPHHGG